MVQFHSGSVQETEEIAAKIAESLRPGDVLAFRGGMGMGKTAFTRGLCKGLGIQAEVSSPTFALVHEYHSGGMTLYHFDMYRVDSLMDLYSTGFFDYLDWGGILAVEWSENIEEALPEGTIYVTLSQPGENPEERVIQLEGGDRF